MKELTVEQRKRLIAELAEANKRCKDQCKHPHTRGDKLVFEIDSLASEIFLSYLWNKL